MGSCGRDHRGLPTHGDGVPAAVAPFEAVVVVAQQDGAVAAGMGASVPAAARRGREHDHRRRPGTRGLAAGNAEVSGRATGEVAAVVLDEIAGHVRKTVARPSPASPDGRAGQAGLAQAAAKCECVKGT
jgi:hypothetical protein